MIRTWLEGLEGREKRLLIVGGLLGLAMLLFLLWRPLAAAQQRLQTQVDQRQALVDWMTRATAEIRQLQPGGGDTTSSEGALTQRIEAWSRQLGLQAKALPGNGTEIKVTLDGASFDRVLDFVDQAGRAGLRASGAEIRALKTPGQVTASLTLSP